MTHLRDEGEALLPAIDEALTIGRAAGVPVHISHLKITGQANWVGSARVLHAIDSATHARIVRDMRALFRAQTASTLESVQFREHPTNPRLTGKTLADHLRALGRPLTLDEGFEAMIALQAAGGFTGVFPRVLVRYVRERRVLTLESAIHKMTGVPAAMIGLPQRGVLREGNYADIAIFDAEHIVDRATYADPHHYAEGVVHLFVNGTAVLRNGAATHARPGAVIRRPQ